MTLDFILPLIAAFVLGAISPGPSLAVVLRNSLSGDRRQGVLAGLGHGFGVYAFLSAVGISAAVAASGDLVLVLRILGIGLLVYLGTAYAHSAVAGNNRLVRSCSSPENRSGFAEGALNAVLIPKMA